MLARTPSKSAAADNKQLAPLPPRQDDFAGPAPAMRSTRRVELCTAARARSPRSIPLARLVCRRRGLQKSSIDSNIADASCALESQFVRSRSSRCIVDQKLSMSALSTLEATRPMDPKSPACRSRCPKIQLVYCAHRSVPHARTKVRPIQLTFLGKLHK